MVMFYPVMPSGLFYPYKLVEHILHFRGVKCILFFLLFLKEMLTAIFRSRSHRHCKTDEQAQVQVNCAVW